MLFYYFSCNEIGLKLEDKTPLTVLEVEQFLRWQLRCAPIDGNVASSLFAPLPF